MRAVLDVNVLVSAVLAPRGTAARLVRSWMAGEFELIVSPLLLAELERVLAYPKIRGRLPSEDARAFVSWLAAFGRVADDPDEPPPVHAPDPDDDYLVTLAAVEDSYLVSGDRPLLSVSRSAPVVSIRRFLTLLEDRSPERG